MLISLGIFGIPWREGMLANVYIVLTGPQHMLQHFCGLMLTGPQHMLKAPQHMLTGSQHNLNIRQHARTIDIP